MRKKIVKKIDEKKLYRKKFQNIAKGVKNEQKKEFYEKYSFCLALLLI